MTTLEHAFNAKDMNSLVLKIIRGQVCHLEFGGILSFITFPRWFRYHRHRNDTVTN